MNTKSQKLGDKNSQMTVDLAIKHVSNYYASQLSKLQAHHDHVVCEQNLLGGLKDRSIEINNCNLSPVYNDFFVFV